MKNLLHGCSTTPGHGFLVKVPQQEVDKTLNLEVISNSSEVEGTTAAVQGMMQAQDGGSVTRLLRVAVLEDNV